MSDNEDAQSEVAPAGWASMFNRVSPTGKKEGRGESSGESKAEAEAEPSSGFLGGWFGGPPKAVSRKSSISSDTPSEKPSEGNSEDGEADERNKWDGDEQDEPVGEDGDAELHTSEVDSDGFPVGTAVEESGAASEEASGSEELTEKDPLEIDESILLAGVGDPEPAPAEPEKPISPRRQRNRMNQNFVIAHSAAEATAEPAEPASWWGAIFPVAAASVPDPTDPAMTEDAKPDVKPGGAMGYTEEAESATAPPPQDVDGVTGTVPSKGMWDSMFGAKDPEPEPVDPRTLLPEIRAPPAMDASAELNSYFSQPPMPASLEIFGPKPFARFHGKVRGWPRKHAPYWSTDGDQRDATTRPPAVSGVAALAMFRVT